MPPGQPPLWQNALAVGLFALLFVGLWRIAGRIRHGRPVVPRRRRRPVPWRAEGGVLAAFVFMGGWTALMSSGDSDAPPSIELRDAASMGLVWLLLAGSVVAWLRSKYAITPDDFGLPTSLGEAVADVGLGLTGCVVMLAPVYAVQLLLVMVFGLPSSHPTIERLLTDPSAGTVAAAVLMAVVIAPLFEELAFRVLLQGWLERLGGRRAWWPIVVSSVLFALAHAGQGWAPVPLAVLALGLGYVYRQTHRLAPVVAMHMAFNALGLAVAIGAAQGRAGERGPAPPPLVEPAPLSAPASGAPAAAIPPALVL